ncbi:MAG: transketolase [Deltaproteobacteria bacterium]|nr:transketolase [Deltaproteobacteria bacterium]MCB9488543.1 transketolase [Deltaproteobacteria bacterium]
MADTPLDAQKLRRVADTIRFLAVDAVQKANSGHPGMPMGCADLAVTLWARHLRFDPDDANWRGRDRFVLSNGHGSMLQYALLNLFTSHMPMDQIRDFRQLHSTTPGHPERGETEGVEVTTGPLGQGIANSVGLALGAKMGSARFGGGEFDPAGYRVFCIVGDGCLMEGISYEAVSLAGHWKLDNLCVFYDDNEISIDGSTDLTFSEDVPARFAAAGWEVVDVDGHDYQAVEQAIERFEQSDRPTLIVTHTKIGYGAPTLEGTAKTHGAALGEKEIAAMREKFGWEYAPFEVPGDVTEFCAEIIQAKKELRADWDKSYVAWKNAREDNGLSFDVFHQRRLPDGLYDTLIKMAPTKVSATRAHGAEVIQQVAREVPALVGGAADLAGSTKTTIKNSPHISAEDFSGQNMHFGIREHAMAAICNGLAAAGGWFPFASTFLVFADYMRPSIRLAAIMKTPTIFVFTHDSFQVGEDGPTHEPIEHLESLRAIPGLRVLRPADGIETAAAWFAALHYDGPTALILTRQDIPAFDRDKEFHSTDLLRGAQVVQSGLNEQATLVATGSEVPVACEAAKILAEKGINVRVVSMLCRRQFQNRPKDDQDRTIPPSLPMVSIEAGVPGAWGTLAKSGWLHVGIDHFGASAPAEDLIKEFGFDPAAVADKIEAWLSERD